LDIKLDGGGSVVYFHSFNSDKNNRILSSLFINGEDSIIDFAYGYTKLFIDDLIIRDGSDLTLLWFSPRSGDGLFVKKTSRHLQDALAKIRIENKSGSVGVRDYNEDYWEIGVGTGFGGLPEPSTYGAILGAVGIGLVVWRNRRRLPN